LLTIRSLGHLESKAKIFTIGFFAIVLSFSLILIFVLIQVVFLGELSILLHDTDVLLIDIWNMWEVEAPTFHLRRVKWKRPQKYARTKHLFDVFWPQNIVLVWQEIFLVFRNAK
jgi:hypothetical protein